MTLLFLSLAGIIAIIVILVSAKFIKAGFDARGEVKEEQREEKLKQEDEDILDELKRKNLSEEDLKDLYEKIQNNKKDKDHFKKNQKKTIQLLKKIKDVDIEIEHQGRKFFAPKNIPNLKKILKKYPNAKILRHVSADGSSRLGEHLTRTAGDQSNRS